MAAANHNIIVGRGEDFSASITVSQDGSPVDLTDDTFAAEVRRGSGRPLEATFTCSITDAGAGNLTITLPKEQTLRLDGDKSYKWDLFRTVDGNGAVSHLIYGDVRVDDNITEL